MRPVLAGEPIIVPVQGGFVRRPAPSDGIEVDVGDTVGFLPWEEARRALDEVLARHFEAKSKKGRRR